MVAPEGLWFRGFGQDWIARLDVLVLARAHLLHQPNFCPPVVVQYSLRHTRVRADLNVALIVGDGEGAARFVGVHFDRQSARVISYGNQSVVDNGVLPDSRSLFAVLSGEALFQYKKLLWVA